MNALSLALMLLAAQPGAALDDEPSRGSVALLAAGGAAAGTMMTIAFAGGIAASGELSGRQDTMLVLGSIALIATPLVAGLVAGSAVSLLVDAGCGDYGKVLVSSTMACLIAYACAALVLAIPLLLAGGGGNSCNGCNDPGDCNGFDIPEAPAPVNGAIMGAAFGSLFGAVAGFAIPQIVVVLGGTLPDVGGVGTDPILQGAALGVALGTVSAAVASGVGSALDFEDRGKRPAPVLEPDDDDHEVPAPAQRPAAALAF